MARPKGSKNRPKTEKNQEQQPNSSPSSDAALAGKMPTTAQVVTLAQNLDEVEGNQGDLAEAKKELIEHAVEAQNFNKYALSEARKWQKRALKYQDKFAIEFPHFLSYVADLGLDKTANEARGLPINGEEQWDNDSPRLSVVPSEDEAA